MSSPRSLIAIVLLGILAISTAYASLISSSTDLDRSGVLLTPYDLSPLRARFGAITNRASANCPAADNSVPPTPEQKREEDKYKKLKSEVEKGKANKEELTWVQHHEQTVLARIKERASRKYPAHVFTDAQMTKAMLAGDTILKAGRSIKPREYPHKFGNDEDLPFDGGKDKYEFPIKMDNTIAMKNENVKFVPDRVVFEWKKGVNPKLLGVMRHASAGARDFVKC